LLITYEWSDWRDGVVWWIQSVYVRPDARQKGVYAGLYQHIKELVGNDPEVSGIRLYVDRRNTGAQQVYARLGMNGEHYQVFEWMKS
jgi:ribosomal protein S18 acetylase RimI-like enzyme